MRAGLLVVLLSIAACTALQRAAELAGLVHPDGPMQQAAREVDHAISAWWWGLLGVAPVAAGAHHVHRRRKRRKVSPSGTPQAH